jgi:transcriptional regulator with XRE-family HTH domain
MGFTQHQMAEAMGVTQATLSKIEGRNDHLVSTIRKGVEALGGELELTATFGEKKIKIEIV